MHIFEIRILVEMYYKIIFNNRFIVVSKIKKIDINRDLTKINVVIDIDIVIVVYVLRFKKFEKFEKFENKRMSLNVTINNNVYYTLYLF